MKIHRLYISSIKMTFWLSCVVYISTHPMPMGMDASMPTQAPSPMPTGPETTGLDEKIGVQGNWIKKRDWLIKANEVGVEIQEAVNQTEQARTSFTSRYNEIDTILDNYYKELGLGEGKIKDLLDNVSHYLDKKRKKDLASLAHPTGEKPDPDMQAKIDIIQDSITNSKQQLEQLTLDMKSIEDLDKSLSDRLKRLDEQINLAHEDADRAQTIINELWNIIDHNKARASYYELKNTILEKVKNTQVYLNEDLSRDFDSVIETIKTQITRTQDQIKKIEADGIFIKDRAKRVKELKLKEIQNRELQGAAQPAPTTTAPAKPKKPQGFLNRVYDLFVTMLSKIYHLWLTLTGQTTSVKKPQQPIVAPTAQPIAQPSATQTSPAPIMPMPSASDMTSQMQMQPTNAQDMQPSSEQVPMMPS